MHMQKDEDKISLSPYTRAFITLLQQIKPKPPVDEFSQIEVSSTASFFSVFYEKIRNAIEYREQNLIRRAAIERILKRRLSLNPSGRGEAENLVKELLWAGYFPQNTLSYNDIEKTQRLINNYLYLYKISRKGIKNSRLFSEFILSLITCEIEELLSPDEAKKQEYYLYFVFQILKNRIKIKDLDDPQLQDLYIFIAVDKIYGQGDKSYLRYHLFKLMYGRVQPLNKTQLKRISADLIKETFALIQKSLENPYSEKIARFIRKEKASFLILREITEKDPFQAEKTLQSKKLLWQQVEQTCQQKYALTTKKLNSAAVKSLIYIFITKMLFALILEYPLSEFIYGEVDYLSIGINSIFPPALMFLIIMLTSPPDEKNTKRIFERIIHIIDKDQSYENSTAFITKKQKQKKPILIFIFSIFYLLTFFLVLYWISRILDIFNFNLISKALFIFFVSVVSFFAYRVRQIAAEYLLSYKSPFYQPIVDFFFMPILSLGRFFSKEMGRLNIFIIIFDFLIEAPFKLIIEIIEEWIKFIRQKKEEISA